MNKLENFFWDIKSDIRNKPICGADRKVRFVFAVGHLSPVILSKQQILFFIKQKKPAETGLPPAAQTLTK